MNFNDYFEPIAKVAGIILTAGFGMWLLFVGKVFMELARSNKDEGDYIGYPLLALFVVSLAVFLFAVTYGLVMTTSLGFSVQFG